MIDFNNIEVVGFEHAIRGMRNPMNSWDKSDSGWYDPWKYTIEEMVGPNDLDLMKSLAKGGPVHAKYRRMIVVYMDITAPLYWWKEFDTYKVGTVANSCSTMHKITEKRFERSDFSIEHLENFENHHWMVCMDNVIASLNVARTYYLKTEKEIREAYEELNGKKDFNQKMHINELKFLKKDYWWQIIQLLPSSYNQKRTVMLNYEVLSNIYKSRENHKLDEWQIFCEEIELLPHSELITI